MHHLIIGYGYCGFYLAQYLLNQGERVTAVSRHQDKSYHLENLNHQIQDINQGNHCSEPDTLLYYFVPPTSEGVRDTLLQQFIASSSLKVRKIIYCGSSAVYGNHQHAWIDEGATCYLDNDRQRRRLDAEQQWQQFSAQAFLDCLILRVAGIYGPHRLPVQAALDQAPLIKLEQAPYSNHIHVQDLVKIAALLAMQPHTAGIYNIADGQPQKMGTLQTLTAKALGITAAPYADFEWIWAHASPMKREFMQSSKRLSIERLKKTFQPSLSLMTLTDGIAVSLKAEKTI